MAEPHSTDTQAVNTPDEHLSLLTESLPDNVLNSLFSSPLPSLEDHLWMDSDDSVTSEEAEKSLSSPLTAPDSPCVSEAEFVFGSELIPAEGTLKAGDTECECSECCKIFRTTDVLSRHLVSHQVDRPYVCDICHQGFKQHDHLTSHLLTHRKRKAHCCEKVSLKHLCASQPEASQPIKPTPTTWELPAVTEGHSLFHSPFRLALISQLEQHAGCAASYSSYKAFVSMVSNLGLNGYPEEGSLLDVKLPGIPETWSLASMDLPASHEALTSKQQAHDRHSWSGNVVADPPASESSETKVSICENDLNFPVTKGSLSVQPCKQADSARMELSSRPSLVGSKTNQGILLKPQNKQSIPFISGTEPSSKSHSEFVSVPSPPSHQRKLSLADPPLPKSRKKRVRKRTKKTADTPAPRTSTQKRGRPSADLISPSQVAMASFSTESTPSCTIKEGSAAAITQDGKESGVRIYLKCPPGCSVQFWSSVLQVSTTSSVKMNGQLMESMLAPLMGEKLDKAAGHIQESQGFHVSPLVIPVSVPVLGKEAPLNKPSVQPVSMQTEEQVKVKRQSKKSRHTDPLSTLIIPRPAESSGQGCQTAASYPSQLCSPTFIADHLLKSRFQPPPYTPPPMLSPLRPGTGLYFCTLSQYQPCPPPLNSCTTSPDEEDIISLMKDKTVVSIKPKINIGSRFQAEIPPLRNRLLSLYDEHPAQLVWAPWGDLPSNPETQQRVTLFLDMCCSSVLPGGGTNTELALHCLHEVQGDILAAVDLLLLRGDCWPSSQPLSNYHYAGSDQWSAQERILFQKALLDHNKDFQQIHNMLQTKSVAQCVEYYYTIKKPKRLKQCSRGVDKTDRTAENSAEIYNAAEEKSATRLGIRRSLNRQAGMLGTGNILEFS